MTRVRVRRERPTAVAVAVALCVTMLVVYVLTLQTEGTVAAQSLAAAPRVTRRIDLEPLKGWCVAMARCDSPEEARLQASAYVNRGAAGYVAQLDGAWRVLGAVYDTGREAERVARRLKDDEGIPAEAVAVEAGAVALRVTAPEAQIEAISGADALLRRQAAQLGQLALQLDHGEIRADAARTLCAVAASEAKKSGDALRAIPGMEESGLCQALIRALDSLSDMQRTLSEDAKAASATLSGMLRCAQIETFIRQAELQRGLDG